MTWRNCGALALQLNFQASWTCSYSSDCSILSRPLDALASMDEIASLFQQFETDDLSTLERWSSSFFFTESLVTRCFTFFSFFQYLSIGTSESGLVSSHPTFQPRSYQHQIMSSNYCNTKIANNDIKTDPLVPFHCYICTPNPIFHFKNHHVSMTTTSIGREFNQRVCWFVRWPKSFQKRPEYSNHRWRTETNLVPRQLVHVQQEPPLHLPRSRHYNPIEYDSRKGGNTKPQNKWLNKICNDPILRILQISLMLPFGIYELDNAYVASASLS